MPLFLTESDVRQLLSLDELRKTMAGALSAFSTGAVEQPLRTVLPIGQQAFMAVMPALIPDTRALGTKLVTFVAGNVEHDIKTHFATMVMINAETGELETIMDGSYITEVRTAAVSAVATAHLGRDVDSSVLALLGSGSRHGAISKPWSGCGQSARFAFGVPMLSVASNSSRRCATWPQCVWRAMPKRRYGTPT